MDFLRIPWNYLCKNKSLIFGDCDSTSVHYVLVPAIKITRFWGLCPIEINIRTKKISVGLYDLAYSMIILSVMSGNMKSIKNSCSMLLPLNKL